MVSLSRCVCFFLKFILRSFVYHYFIPSSLFLWLLCLSSQCPRLLAYFHNQTFI
jgi:hypothetical protein